jgi:hypothetical protein
MANVSEQDVLECACLHKQITERVGCPHSPSHLDLGDAVVRLLGTADPATQRAVQAACSRGRLAQAIRHPSRGRLFLLSAKPV